MACSKSKNPGILREPPQMPQMLPGGQISCLNMLKTSESYVYPPSELGLANFILAYILSCSGDVSGSARAAECSTAYIIAVPFSGWEKNL